MKKVIGDQYEDIIKTVANKLGYSEELVDNVIKTVVSWQISSIINEEYVAYFWDKFGTWSFFNRKNGKYFKEVDVYKNNKSRKNKHMKVIRPDDESDEDYKIKQDLINEIIQYSPELRPNQFIKYAYLIDGDLISESEWNINYMLSDTLNNVRECLSILKQKNNNNNESKN